MSIAIITGASSGIGKEFAKQLHQNGEVDGFWFIARRKEVLEELRDELGVEAKVICADLTTEEGIDAYRHALEEEKPEVSYLINSAGMGVFGSFEQLTEKQVVSMLDLNIKATVLLTHMTVPYMKKGGRIIELGSGSCFTPLPYFNIYSSSKVFVLHYTKSLNYELKPYAIRATCLCPGWVDTDLLVKLSKDKDRRHPKSFKPKLRVDYVVKKGLKAAKKGKTMCVINWYTKMQHVLFKLLPDSILSKIWLKMLTKS